MSFLLHSELDAQPTHPALPCIGGYAHQHLSKPASKSASSSSESFPARALLTLKMLVCLNTSSSCSSVRPAFHRQHCNLAFLAKGAVLEINMRLTKTFWAELYPIVYLTRWFGHTCNNGTVVCWDSSSWISFCRCIARWFCFRVGRRGGCHADLVEDRALNHLFL